MIVTWSPRSSNIVSAYFTALIQTSTRSDGGNSAPNSKQPGSKGSVTLNTAPKYANSSYSSQPHTPPGLDSSHLRNTPPGLDSKGMGKDLDRTVAEEVELEVMNETLNTTADSHSHSQ